MQKIKQILKDEIVLIIGTILAIISSCVVGIDKKYIDYIDFRTLGILFCLMVVVAGFKGIGIFDKMATALLRKAKDTRKLFYVLVLLCFVSGMIITNDVALITFVPLSLIIFRNGTGKMKAKWMPLLITLETIAANLGSMLTPIGNPQNLYLYTKSNMSFFEFVTTMLPYTLASCAIIIILIFIITRKKEVVEIGNGKLNNKENNNDNNDNYMCNDFDSTNNEGVFAKSIIKLLIVYSILFIASLAVVLRIIDYIVVLVATILAILLFDRKIIKKVDYSLLLTFVAFFVFVGNLQQIDAFNTFFEKIVVGKEVGTAILLSQVISNVPATFLLSGFTSNFKELLVGVNIGGLGTLIASMASLISYKFLAKEEPEFKGKYFLYFTVMNVIFLICMILFSIII